MHHKAVLKETGEVIKNLYYDDKTDEVKRIDYERFDYIISQQGDKVELMFFKEGFNVPKHLAYDDEFMFDMYTFPEMETVLNQRKYKSVNGVAVPLNESVTLMDLQNTINSSSKRSIKNFYNYALANEWEYFCTFTFKDSLVRNDKDLLYQTWNKWLYMVRKVNKEVKAIAVYEKFEKGGFHIHGLLADCNLTLLPARNDKTQKFMYSEFGNQLFNSADWKHGFSNIVCINPDSVQTQVVNYMCKYMTKESPAPFGCKRYFHTNNLNVRNTYCGKFEKPEFIKGQAGEIPFEEILRRRKELQSSDKFSLPKAILQFNLHVAKDKKNVVVYRNY